VIIGLVLAGATTLHAQSRARANSTAARHLNTQRTLSSNYGSMQKSSSSTTYSYEGAAGSDCYYRNHRLLPVRRRLLSPGW